MKPGGEAGERHAAPNAMPSRRQAEQRNAAYTNAAVDEMHAHVFIASFVTSLRVTVLRCSIAFTRYASSLRNIPRMIIIRM